MWPAATHAYLDPGTGSYVIQILIAGIVGGAYAVKLFGQNIAGFFRRLFGKKPAAAKQASKDEGSEQ